jgi:hypothetical protein
MCNSFGIASCPTGPTRGSMARLKTGDSGARRTAFVGANLTPLERAEVERRAESTALCLSEFVRRSLLSKRPDAALSARLSNDVARKLAVELARVGTNLNQLAHHANATGAMPAGDALHATLREIVKATEVLTTL